MAFLTGIATSIVEKAAEHAVRPVCRQLGYLFYYKNNVDGLKIQIQELEYAGDRLQHRIEEARRNGEEIEADVENWLSNVEKIKEESNNFLQNEDHAKTRCSSNGPFPNLVSRHQLSRKAKKMMLVVVGEICKAEKFEKISYRPPIQHAIANQGYEAFESRVQALKEIIEALKDINVRMIGMYGMGGIGKTVLAKEVARIAKEEKLFDEVAFTTVSQSPDVGSIQQEIAERLGLQKFYEIKSLNVRADRLRHRLSQEKNILVILDDVWNELNLSIVGIDFSSHQKGCKILLTSRSRNVLQDSMGVERNIEVKVLSETEAMDLFRKNVGSSSEDVHFQPLAKKIVKECGGLPIAITTVAHALRNKSLSIWNDALRQLERSMPVNIEGMDQKVYASIKLSYDFLDHDEEAKSLLLLSSLHEEDANIGIENLMIYALGWGLFREVYTIEEARNRVDSLIIKLKGRCLLLDGDYDDGAVKMHDIIRDVMLSIASQDKRMHSIVNVDRLGGDFSTKKKITDSTAVSLLVPQLAKKLPDRLECPQLELLFVFKRSQNYLQIPEQYFEEKKDLKVLLLNKVGIGSLPASFCLLQNLQALSLHRCVGNITLIGELKNLKILDLSGSTIEELPKPIGQLTHLQLLKLEFCRDLKVIQPGVISSLIKLEELNMRGVSLKWEDRGVNGERSNASLTELKSLPELTCICLSIQDINTLPKALFSKKLKRFELSIGEKACNLYGRMNVSSLHLHLTTNNLLSEFGLEMIMKRSAVLYLYGFEGVNSIIYELDEEGFCQLRSFGFEDNNQIQYVVNSTGTQPCRAFPNLERLSLVKLKDLERIYCGELSRESFGKLKVLKIESCDKLKNLFSSSIARLFEEINVNGCKMMKEIVSHEMEDDTHNAVDTIEFPHLRFLTLEDLPEFVQFIRTEMETTDTSSSDSPMPLFSKKVAFPCLESLQISGMKFKDLCSYQLPTTSHFRNLETIIVYKCNNLKHLLPFAVAKNLVHLAELAIAGCLMMEEVLFKEKEEDGLLEKISFPKMRRLWLDDLPKLEKFCIGDTIEFPMVSRLCLTDCPRLKTFIKSSEIKSIAEQPFFSEKVMFLELRFLYMDGREVINRMWHPQFSTVPFCMLGYLSLTYNDEKSIFFPFGFIQRFQNLKNLMFEGSSVEEICQHQEIDASQELDGPVLHMRRLSLTRLPDLRHLFENPENFKSGKAFQNIEVLSVEFCDKLKRLVPFLDYFRNLRDLEVSRCEGMKSLFASSTAKSLVQLTRMSIRKCQQMREIVACKEDGTEDEIVFERLRILALYELPSLESFYSGNGAMRFPILDKVILIQCPQMEVFSHGIVTTQKLNQIITSVVNKDDLGYLDGIEYELYPRQQLWKGDINSTIRKIWEDDPIITPQDLFNED